MKRFTFTRSGFFFDELYNFSLTLVGLMALARFPELKGQIQELVTRYNHRAGGVPLPSTSIPNIVIPDNGAVVGNVASCTLIKTQEFVQQVQIGGLVTGLTYVDIDLVSSMTGNRRELGLKPGLPLHSSAQITIGSAYERAKDSLEVKLGDDPWAWPPLLQYFRHCRNAAFHGNQFNVRGYKGRPGINVTAPPTWRSSVMPDDASMNSRGLIGDWIEAGDVPVLLGDVSELLNQHGITP